LISDPNIIAVEQIVVALGSLTDELLLVGGSAVGLLVDDPGATPIRPTKDVDMVTEATPRTEYYKIEARLREAGFVQPPSTDVICRWSKGDIMLDLMPADPAILGFTNTWYAPAVRHPTRHRLPSGKHVARISAPYFLATKLESFAARGGGDFMQRDMEDIITVIDGRASIDQEALDSPDDLRGFLRDEFEALLSNAIFQDHLNWLLEPSTANHRRPIVLQRLRHLAGL